MLTFYMITIIKIRKVTLAHECPFSGLRSNHAFSCQVSQVFFNHESFLSLLFVFHMTLTLIKSIDQLFCIIHLMFLLD